MKINSKLKEYIKNNIFQSYKRNDHGHDLEHIKYVIERSLKFASTVENINYDMVYTIAAYHDIGHYIDAKNHEKISAEILEKDENKIVVSTPAFEKEKLTARLLRYDFLCKVLYPKTFQENFKEILKKSLDNLKELNHN